MRKSSSKFSVNTNELEVIEETNSMYNTHKHEDRTLGRGKDQNEPYFL